MQRIYKDRAEAEKRLENVTEFLNYIGQFELSFHQENGGVPRCWISWRATPCSTKTTAPRRMRTRMPLSCPRFMRPRDWNGRWCSSSAWSRMSFRTSAPFGKTDWMRSGVFFYVAITRARELLYLTYCGRAVQIPGVHSSVPVAVPAGSASRDRGSRCAGEI